MKVAFVSLGCAKNLVNTEQMMALVRSAGHEITAQPEGADAAVLNTCGFIDSAKSEAIQNILELAELKKEGKLGKLLVTGCLSQRYQDELMEELPEVDGVMGTGSYTEIVPALEELMAGKDSCGGVVECIIHGMPAGAGEPVFEKLDANLAKAMLSIGAVKGFEIGDGFAASRARGSENNDGFGISHKAADGSPHLSGRIEKQTNHSGGTLGGISDGSDIVVRAGFKPTPSVAASQQTINKDGENIAIEIKGRHDPIIVARAVVVVECMTALVLADALLVGMSAKLDNVKKVWALDEK